MRCTQADGRKATEKNTRSNAEKGGQRHRQKRGAARCAPCLALLAVLALTFSACGSAAGAAQSTAGASDSAAMTGSTSAASTSGKADGAYYAFTDDLGNTVTLTKKPEAVVSLFGSYAEMWLLAGGTLAGVTEDAVSERGMTLAENVSVIGSVKEPNLELVLQAQPDFVLLSTDVEAHVKLDETLTQASIPHAYFKEDTVDDYLRVLKIYTDITGRQDLYAQHGDSVKQQIDTLLAGIPKEQETPSVLLIRSMSTKAKALKDDHMVGKMLADLQADNIATRHASLLEDLSLETILQEDPDCIFVVTMGDVDAAVQTLENGIMANPAWQTLSAVKNGNYYVLPKDLFQYKPNARWGESYSYLEKILYP